MTKLYINLNVEQPYLVPFTKWEKLHKEQIDEIFYITRNNLKNVNNIIINDDKLYSNLAMLIYNTSFNRYKKYKLY